MPDSNPPMREPLAVVGLSCLFPQAADIQEFWSNLRNGVDAITEIPSSHWDVDDYFNTDPKSPDMTYARRGGFLSAVAFDPLEFGIAPSNLEAIDTSQLLGLVGAKRALDDAGYGVQRQFDRSRVSCILGVTGTLEMVIPLGARLGHPKWRQALQEAGVADDVAADVIQRISESYVPWQENSFPGLLGNVVAGRIANRLDLGGTNCVVDAACASSLSAIHLASLELWSGRSDMVVTGGVDTFNDIFMFMCFSKTPALSPTGDAKPFSDTGDGTILGEGVGMLVLKRLRDAERDGDRIYALIRGIGTSSDGAGNAVYAPKKEGQVRCLQDAYRVAGVSPDTVELIEAHGTGTKVGDATELAGLNEVFQASGQTGRWCAVGSIKSQIGHTKAAAGAAGILKAILALQHRVLPPTIKIDQPLPALQDAASPLYANTLARPWLRNKHHPRRAGVSAFGFGGSNFHCVLEESPHGEPGIDWNGDVFFAAFSADSRAELSRQLAGFPVRAGRQELRAAAAETRQRFWSSQEHRLVIVAEFEPDKIERLLAAAQEHLQTFRERTSWSTPDGICYDSGRKAGRLGMLFPGQGSQYVNMQRELACRFPLLQEVLAEANDVFAAFSSPVRTGRLSDVIYPIPAFSVAAREAQDQALRDTEIAQPALGAVSLGVLAILDHFGVRPDVVAGHSYGELTALCASKRFSADSLYRLSMLRGRLMAEAQEIEGGMLAVGAPLSQVEAALKEAAVDLVIANSNSPTQVVLSGRVSELNRMDEVLLQRNIRGKRLPVSAAFHSPLVASASGRFRPVLNEVEFARPDVPVYANTNAEIYPEDADEARSLLARQLSQPVQFVQQIENMYAAGVRVFLEVGPGAVLTGLVSSILSGREHRTISVDASGGRRSGMLDLALALGQLAVAGIPVHVSAWDPEAVSLRDSGTPDAQRLTIPICGANYVKPRTPRPPRQAAAPDTRSQQTPQMNLPRPEEILPPPAAPSNRPVETRIDVSQPTSPTAPPVIPLSGVEPSALMLLQQMFEQTAQVHKQFLESQEAALLTLQRLATGGGNLPESSSSLAAPVVSWQETVPAEVRLPAPRVASSVVPSESAAASREPVSAPITETRPTKTTTAPVVTDDSLTPAVLQVVSEKTGYPVEMLKPEMSLDHDLGIDSIKRVEILSALQERRPDLPAVKPEQLGTLHRLEDVIALLSQLSPSTPPTGVTPSLRMAEPPPVRPEPPPRSTTGHLAQAVLAVVSEKTGYPVEMLKPEMSLDHDLGIDSIKRVEILSALQERHPDLPAVKPEQLGTLHRLEDVIALLDGVETVPVVTNQASSTATVSSPPRPMAEPTPSAPADTRSSLDVGRPEAVLLRQPGRKLNLPPGSMFLVTEDGSDLSLWIVQQLTRLGYRARLVRIEEPASHARPEELAGLILISPERGMTDQLLWRALEWTQKCGPALRKSGPQHGSVLVTISRQDGQFGLSSENHSADPLSGSLAGLAKTVRHEWPEVTATAVDLAPGVARSLNLVPEIVDQMLCAGPPEIGLSAAGWSQVDVVDVLPAEAREAPIQPGDVVLVTGGARGVTAAAALAVAKAWRPRLVLCGRTPLISEPDELAAIHSPTELKQALAHRSPAGTPLRQIDQQYRQLLANREIQETLRAIRAEGVSVEYLPVDIRELSTLQQTMRRIVSQFGPIRGLIHGAGVLEDRRIEDKTRDQFESVFSTKITGLRNLLATIDADALKCLAAFSSYTGRYGRVGQVDYAMANEALNKLVSQFRTKHPHCRAKSFNWGPWDGGMVTDSLKPLFAREGVGLIPLADGASLLVAELERRDATSSPELVVLARNKHGQDAAPAAPTPPVELKTEASSLLPLVLEVVAEKTGYPVEMLKPGMSLDHDLGIDSIKRVEILSALQERRPDLPSVKPEQLGTLHRLSDVIALLESATMVPEPAAERPSPVRLPDSSAGTSPPPHAGVTPTASAGLQAPRAGWERVLDVQSHPYLESHVIGGKAVLPTAMIVECLGHAALHFHPGLEFLGFQDLRIFKGVRLDRRERIALRVVTEKAFRDGPIFRTLARLVSDSQDREVLHAQAEVVLSGQRPQPMKSRLLPTLRHQPSLPVHNWYDELLFHGAMFQGLRQVEVLNSAGILVQASTGSSPAAWLRDAWRGAWLADPLTLDVVLQAIIVWTQVVCQRASLPTGIASYRQYQRSFPVDGVQIAIRAQRRNDATVAADAEILDRQGNVIAEMTGVEYVLDAQLSAAFRRNRLE